MRILRAPIFRLVLPPAAALCIRAFWPARLVFCAASTRSPLEDCVTPMSRLVMKFGGTSVANIERIRNVARHVK
ncbi:MAG: hypothetical protein ACLP1D_03990, partial [Xanthobacteraceae bacterium]